MPALCCNLLLFSALYRQPHKKILKCSQGDKKNALPPHHDARLLGCEKGELTMGGDPVAISAKTEATPPNRHSN
jgi:hypothetical protein